jgi:hypothetical protein
VSDAPRDYFDRARLVAATGLFIAAVCLIVGCFLDWVTVDQLPDVIPADQAAKAEPFNGFDVRDGYIVAGAAIVLLVSAVGRGWPSSLPLSRVGSLSPITAVSMSCSSSSMR